MWYARRITGLITLFVIGLSTMGGLASSAWAGAAGCRTDPILWFGNGDKLSIVSSVSASRSDIDVIEYTVHAPAEQEGDQEAVKVVKTGNINEKVLVVFDLPLDSDYAYTVDTIVKTKTEGDQTVDVLVTTKLHKAQDQKPGVGKTWTLITLGVER